MDRYFYIRTRENTVELINVSTTCFTDCILLLRPEYSSKCTSRLVFQLLLKLIVDHLAEFTAEPGVFTMFSEQLKKTYFNILIKPERLGKYVTLTLSSWFSCRVCLTELRRMFVSAGTFVC